MANSSVREFPINLLKCSESFLNVPHSISREYTKSYNFILISSCTHWCLGRNITHGRISSILMILHCYVSITTYSYINTTYQSMGEIRSEVERTVWWGTKSKTDEQKESISNGSQQMYIFLCFKGEIDNIGQFNSIHELEVLLDFSLTLNFIHY